MPQPQDDTPPSSDFRIDDLIVRGIIPDDAEGLTDVLNLPGVRLGTLRQPFQSVACTRQYIEGLSRSDIVVAAEWRGRILGNAGLHAKSGRQKHVATLGIGIHDDFVGKGIGSRLLAALIDAAENWHDIHRIDLTVFTDNTAAVHLYEKFGFEIEGTLRNYAFRNGTYADSYLMARLR
ncbi:GNAT family N-acetyltransferase [Agrobacterium tumefaciens]|uniref:GNAT family N-acetyltransferase n=1 Tax=Agrobacterium tumefaciens TaxID=358 RepID=UPI0021D0CBEF|nr:GNAT family N-acetyltransferase [Agrobacterium tumefaciens]UXS02012.1 GNAT family N-acetyltransferase [Agrobacterium tumefaciens]